MLIRLLLVFSYIGYCLRLGVSPRRYFQLNADYFNEKRSIFSKLDIDRLIPDRWRLSQILDIGNGYPDRYPVFVKPEWGQNSHGIQRADNAEQLDALRNRRTPGSINYLIQQAAPGKREFEIFVIPAENPVTNSVLQPAVISVVETLNLSGDPLPINGIYNRTTEYHDISDQFSPWQLQKLWDQLQQIGHFRIARYGIRANSLESLIEGDFHIFEINLFVPMPLALVAKNRSHAQKINFCLRCMWHLALITKTIPLAQSPKSIFFSKLRLSRTMKSTREMRPYNERV